MGNRFFFCHASRNGSRDKYILSTMYVERLCAKKPTRQPIPISRHGQEPKHLGVPGKDQAWLGTIAAQSSVQEPESQQ